MDKPLLIYDNVLLYVEEHMHISDCFSAEDLSPMFTKPKNMKKRKAVILDDIMKKLIEGKYIDILPKREARSSRRMYRRRQIAPVVVDGAQDQSTDHLHPNVCSQSDSLRHVSCPLFTPAASTSGNTSMNMPTNHLQENPNVCSQSDSLRHVSGPLFTPAASTSGNTSMNMPTNHLHENPNVCSQSDTLQHVSGPLFTPEASRNTSMNMPLVRSVAGQTEHNNVCAETKDVAINTEPRGFNLLMHSLGIPRVFDVNFGSECQVRFETTVHVEPK